MTTKNLCWLPVWLPTRSVHVVSASRRTTNKARTGADAAVDQHQPNFCDTLPSFVHLLSLISGGPWCGESESGV